MKIRTKLIISVLLLIVVHLTSAALAIRAVQRNAHNTDVYTRMRDLGQLAADLRTDIYHQLASQAGAPSPLHEPMGVGWPAYALDDIDVQIRLSDDEFDVFHWKALRAAIVSMHEDGIAVAAVNGTLREAEHHIRSIRSQCSLRESQAIATVATASFRARVAMTVAGIFTVILFLVYLLMVWRWFVQPVDVLQRSTDILGTGSLDHRVALSGNTELAELGRRMDAMASSLSKQQRELVETRELSAIGELCTNVAHGLRNPLASLRATAQLAGKRADDPEETKLGLLELIRQVDRIDKRITQLFDFSRPRQLERRPHLFSDLAEAAIAETGRLASSKLVKIKLVDQTGDCRWYLDHNDMSQALSELLTNAIHHCDEGDTVTLLSRTIESDQIEDGPTLVIEVRDTGRGIPVAAQQRVFDLFFTSRDGGSGMGLAMVRRSVQRHGGRIEVKSEPGVGTVFSLIMPMPAQVGDRSQVSQDHAL